MSLTNTVKLGISAFALVLLLGSNAAFASSSQPFSGSLAGGVANAGDQKYNVHGGQIVAFALNGNPFDPSSLKLEYSMHATVTGESAQGTFNFQVESSDGASQAVSVEGEGQITGTFLSFDLGTSMVPLYFSGVATINVQQGDGTNQQGSNQNEQVLTDVPMVFESPYLNPFGNPIVIASADLFAGATAPAFVIVGTYTTGTIEWRNVVAGGQIQGLLGSTPFSGTFSQVAKSNENLVAGTETDSGTVTFSGITSVPALNGNGEYRGNSTIPATPSSDCSPPGLPNTCTNTGLISTGQFTLRGTGLKVTGSYNTAWGIPALGFSSTITGTSTSK